MKGHGFNPWPKSLNITRLGTKKKKQTQYCNKFNKDFKKNGPHQKKCIEHLECRVYNLPGGASGGEPCLPMQKT